MNRLTLTIIAAAFSIAILIAVFSIGSRAPNSNITTPSPTPKSIINVKITIFNYTAQFAPVGVNLNYIFLFNYVNNGTTDIENVTVTFGTQSTITERIGIVVLDTPPSKGYVIGSNIMGEPYSLGLIRAGEEKLFRGMFSEYTFNIHGFVLVAILKSNDTVLDRAVVTFQ